MDPAQIAETGALVQRERKKRKWSAKELADRAGVAPNTVLRIEGGEKPVLAGNLRAVLDALGVAPQIDGQAWPQDVALVRDVVGKYLLALPEGDRNAAVSDLIAFMLARGANVTDTTGE